MSLARGLDYYTGIIYEAIVEASAPPGFQSANAFASSSSQPSTSNTTPPASAPKKKAKKAAADDEEEEIDESTVGVGSIAAGGRYDNLVGMFTAAAAGGGKKAPGLPCIGVSIGLDRVFAILWPKWVERGMRSKDTMAYVMAAGDGLLTERVSLVQELREAGIKVGHVNHTHPSIILMCFSRVTSCSRASRNFLRNLRRGRETKCLSRSFLVAMSSSKGSSQSRSRNGNSSRERRGRYSLRIRA